MIFSFLQNRRESAQSFVAGLLCLMKCVRPNDYKNRENAGPSVGKLPDLHHQEAYIGATACQPLDFGGQWVA
jgi:hypothetical protein